MKSFLGFREIAQNPISEIEHVRNQGVLLFGLSATWFVILTGIVVWIHGTGFNNMLNPYVTITLMACFGLAPLVIIFTYYICMSSKQVRRMSLLSRHVLGTFDRSSTPMIIIGLNHKIIRANMKAHKALGYGQDELIGMEIEAIATSFKLELGDKPNFIESTNLMMAINDTMKYSKPFEQTATEFRGKHGEIPVTFNLEVLQDEPDKLLILTFRDVSERKNLVFNEQLYHNLSEMLMTQYRDGLILFNSDDRIMYFNPKMERTFGALEETYVDISTYLKLIAKNEDDYKLMKVYKNASISEAEDFEVTLTDCNRLDYEAVVKFFSLSVLGQPYGLMVVKEKENKDHQDMDMTALSNELKIFKSVFQYAPSLLCVMDAQGNVLHMNMQRRIEDVNNANRNNRYDYIIDCMYEIPKHMNGDSPRSCQHCDVKENIVDALKSRHTIYSKEGTFQHYGGREGTTYVVYSLTYLGQEEDSPVLIAIEDVTEQRISKREVIAREIQYKKLFESSRDGIVLLSIDGYFVDVNQAFLDFSGYTYDELIGMNYRQITPKEWVDIEDRFMNEEIIKTGYISVYEKQYYHQSGHKIDAELTGFIIDDEMGGPQLICGIVRDMSEKKVLVRQIREAQKMQAIGLLAGGIAHDFNNILSGMIGYTDLALLEVLPGTKVYKYLLNISNGQDRAKKIVRQILTFSRRTPSEKSVFYIDYVVHEVEELIKASMPSTVNFRSEVEGELTVYADSTNIHEVVMNMITNAIYAVREKGQIDLKVYKERIQEPMMGVLGILLEGDYVVISVTDDGQGIPKEMVHNIFDPFFTTKEQGKGTGLGLSVVYGIMQNHDGNIRVQSGEGIGTTISLYFPFSHEKVGEGRVNELPKANKVLKILFLDDEEVLVDLATELFRKMGHQIVAIDNGETALEILGGQHDFDLLITDYSMPKMTGIELIEALRKGGHTIPAIVCTGNLDLVTGKVKDDLGILKVLGKPISMYELADTIKLVGD